MINEAKSIVKKGKATELSQKVAEVLVNLRNERQLSQRAFAEHIGVSFQQYQKYEKGKDRLSLEKAMLLCNQLGLSLDVFMEEEAAYYGFAEPVQAAFDAKPPAISKEEQQILDIFAGIPKKAKQDFLETVKQLAKMASAKS